MVEDFAVAAVAAAVVASVVAAVVAAGSLLAIMMVRMSILRVASVKSILSSS